VLILCGVVAAAAAITRSAGLVLLLILPLWALLAVSGAVRARLRRAATILVPGVAVLGIYVGAAHAAGGMSGLTEMGGWDLYGRVAPFADCTKFTPPAGTESVCENALAPDKRPGPFYYVWIDASPGRRNFPLTPEASDQLGQFARAAIVHQPLAYLHDVAVDVTRFFDSSLGRKPAGAGTTHDYFTFANYNPELERLLADQIGAKYTGAQPPDGASTKSLATYQMHVRPARVLLVTLLLGGVLGLLFGRSRERWSVVLPLVVAMALYVGPAMTISYDIRYGIPAQPFLAQAGVLGLAAATKAVARRRRPPPAHSARAVAASSSAP
jgi:hypothetical protein